MHRLRLNDTGLIANTLTDAYYARVTVRKYGSENL